MNPPDPKFPKWLLIVAAFLLGAMILSTMGCSSTTNPGSMIGQATKAMGISNPVFQVPTAIQDNAIAMIDSLCPPPASTTIPGDKGFLEGLIDGAPIDKDDVLSVKQNEDLKRLMRLCAKPKDQRPLYEYGYLTSRGVNGLFGLAMKAAALIK
jgi:hypothetical protein